MVTSNVSDFEHKVKFLDSVGMLRRKEHCLSAYVQGDKLYMAAGFWYLVKRDLLYYYMLPHTVEISIRYHNMYRQK